MTASTTISATYRLQFNKDFNFRDASELLDYFRGLGVTHIYASPILRSRHGSSHGYDVIDPSHLNPELGTEADFQAFHEELEKRGMGLIVDIVPNHMAASSETAWWTSKQNWVKIRPRTRSMQGSPPQQSLCRTARPQTQLQPRWVKSAFSSNSW